MGSIKTIKPLLSTALRSSTVNKPWQHWKTSGMPGIKPGTGGCEAQTLPLYYAIPPAWVRCQIDYFVSGDVQRSHRQKDERSDLPGPDLLPTSEAHGGRQDPQQGQRPTTDPRPSALRGSCQGRWPPIRRDGARYCCSLTPLPTSMSFFFL